MQWEAGDEKTEAEKVDKHSDTVTDYLRLGSFLTLENIGKM